MPRTTMKAIGIGEEKITDFQVMFHDIWGFHLLILTGLWFLAHRIPFITTVSSLCLALAFFIARLLFNRVIGTGVPAAKLIASIGLNFILGVIGLYSHFNPTLKRIFHLIVAIINDIWGLSNLFFPTYSFKLLGIEPASNPTCCRHSYQYQPYRWKAPQSHQLKFAPLLLPAGFKGTPSDTDLLLIRNAYYPVVACGVFIWFYPVQPELAFALSLGVIALQLAVMVLTQQWRKYLVRAPTALPSSLLPVPFN